MMKTPTKLSQMCNNFEIINKSLSRAVISTEQRTKTHDHYMCVLMFSTKCVFFCEFARV